MATFAFSTMALPQGVTFVFGSSVCVSNGLGGFNSHLTNPMGSEATSSENCNATIGSDDHGDTLLPDLAKEIEQNSMTIRAPLGLRLISTQVPLGLELSTLKLSSGYATHHLLISG